MNDEGSAPQMSGRPGPIRAATPADAIAIARLHAASWAAALGMEAQAPLGTGALAEWKERLRAAPGTTLVALDGDVLLGFATAGQSEEEDAVDGETAELFALYVAPDEWGQGVGRRLWRATRQRLQTEGFREVRLWVLEANFRARSLYERLGFAHENGVRREAKVGEAQLPEVRYRLALDEGRRTD